VLMNLDEDFTHEAFEGGRFDPASIPEATAADRWILSRLAATTEAVLTNLEAYNLDDAGRTLYEFVWGDYCDWYVEMAKPRLQGENRAAAQAVLAGVLEQTLRLLHPFMPFVTEELYEALREKAPACTSDTPLIVAPYARATPEWRDADAEQQMAEAFGVVEALRSVRAALNVPPGQTIRATVAPRPETSGELHSQEWIIRHMARAEVTFAGNGERPPKAWPAQSPAAEVYVPVEGLLDVETATARALKDLESVAKDLARTQGKLGNQGFVAKAPEAVIEKEREIEQELLGKRQALTERLELLRSLA